MGFASLNPSYDLGRVVLRRACAGDLDAMHAILADAETMKYWATPPHADKHASVVFLDYLIPGPETEGDQFVIEFEGALIGKVGVWRDSEVGFILAREFWGRGLAREALAWFIEYAFAQGKDHLTAEADPLNAASVGLLQRVGFVETGRAERTYRIGGVWSDSVYFRLDRTK